jgi:hypothetical protein
VLSQLEGRLFGTEQTRGNLRVSGLLVRLGLIGTAYRIFLPALWRDPNDAEQALIARMKAMRADGMSFARIADRLNLDRVPTKRGGTWASMTVKKILDRAA